MNTKYSKGLTCFSCIPPIIVHGFGPRSYMSMLSVAITCYVFGTQAEMGGRTLLLGTSNLPTHALPMSPSTNHVHIFQAQLFVF